MNNNKKEFPVNGDEEDATYGRNIYRCFTGRRRSKETVRIKKKMNRRFRRNTKPSVLDAQFDWDEPIDV